MPTEILIAGGLDVLFPENHSAACSAKQLGTELCEIAEAAGLSQETCSYTRADLAVRLGGPSPYGGMSKPDVVVACTLSCTTMLKWFQDIARHYDCELVVVDMPYNFSGAITDHSLDYIVGQFQEVIGRVEAVTGEPYDMKRLEHVLELSKSACEYWRKCLELGATKPSPLTTADMLVNLGPMTCLRGTQEAVDVYKSLYEELSARVAEGYAAAGEERYRLVWDNIPFWFALGSTVRYLSEFGAVLVGATYLYHWVRDIDPKAPLVSLAREFATSCTMNQSVAHKIEKIGNILKAYQADGMIIHSNRSCKSDSLGTLDLQREIMKRHGIPVLMVDGDHTDPRAYSEAVVQTRIQAFIESIDAARAAASTASADALRSAGVATAQS
jgi:bcr-type benzoyl-CoA reductase subunit B